MTTTVIKQHDPDSYRIKITPSNHLGFDDFEHSAIARLEQSLGMAGALYDFRKHLENARDHGDLPQDQYALVEGFISVFYQVLENHKVNIDEVYI